MMSAAARSRDELVLRSAVILEVPQIEIAVVNPYRGSCSWWKPIIIGGMTTTHNRLHSRVPISFEITDFFCLTIAPARRSREVIHVICKTKEAMPGVVRNARIIK